MIDREWLYYCMQAGEFLYGFFPVEVLKKMYETKKGCAATIDDLLDAAEDSRNTLLRVTMGKLPGPENAYQDSAYYLAPVLVRESEAPKLYEVLTKAKEHGNPFADLHLDEELQTDLLREQSIVDYYQPTESEILSLVRDGYIRTQKMTDLENYLETHGGNTGMVVRYWQEHLTELDLDKDTPSRALNDCGISFGSIDDINAFIRIFMDCLNNGNMRSRRGYTPDALFQKQRKMYGDQPIRIVPGSQTAAKMLWQGRKEIEAMGAQISFDDNAGRFYAVGPYGERQELKVYPNDPCPCGSGKKFKKCHGRFIK